jgi:hypothetical protein
MKRIVCIFIIVIAGVMFTQAFLVSGKVKQKEKEWSDKFKDGTIITKTDLKKILAGHMRWLKTRKGWLIPEKKEEQKADLSGASLYGANLSGANLRFANLSGAYLKETVFELKPKVVPEIKHMAFSVNLSELTYLISPHSLVALHEKFKKAGQRIQEREVTHAIKSTHRRI